MKFITLIIITIVFLGCSTTIPPKVEYRINSKVNIQSLSQSGCKNKSVKVSQAFSSSTLLSRDMSYGLGDSKQYVYSEALWSINPNRAVTAEFLALIRDSNLFKNVQVSKSRSKNDIILELNIEDFMQYFSEDSTRSYANIVISIALIDARKNSVFASKTFSERIDILELNSNGGVHGLNTALNNILLKSNFWLGQVCK